MKINFNNHISYNSSIICNKFATKQVFKGGITRDVFEKNNKPKQIQQAKERIIKALTDKNSELLVVINPDGSIYESMGDNKKCEISSNSIKMNAILIHGHPEEIPLSPDDVATLLLTDAKSQEAITKDDKYSKLTKKQNFKLNCNPLELSEELSLMLYKEVMDKLAIDYNYTEEDIIKMLKDALQCEQINLTYEEALEILGHKGIKISDDINKTAEEIKKKLLKYQMQYYPRQYNNIYKAWRKNFNVIYKYLQSDEYKKCADNFLKHVAEKYNLKYETNMKI